MACFADKDALSASIYAQAAPAIESNEAIIESNGSNVDEPKNILL